MVNGAGTAGSGTPGVDVVMAGPPDPDGSRRGRRGFASLARRDHRQCRNPRLPRRYALHEFSVRSISRRDCKTAVTLSVWSNSQQVSRWIARTDEAYSGGSRRGDAMDSRVIPTREELLFQLAVACELEQGLCLQYLFTAFSLKDGFSEGGIHTQEQLTYVRQWKSNILLIAAQEMLHLTQAGNLIAAAGGTVQLRRPNFPQPPGYYPTGLPWQLDPFSPDVIRRYVCYERPEPWHDPPLT